MHLASKLPAHFPVLYRWWERIYSLGVQVGNHSRDFKEEHIEIPHAEGIDRSVPHELVDIKLAVNEVIGVNHESRVF